MSLSMHISSKTQKNKKNEKRRIRKFFEFVKALKYDILILCEVIFLACAFVFSSADKKKRSTLFASLSTLFGAYLTLSCVGHVKDGVEKRKLVDILSSDKNNDDD